MTDTANDTAGSLERTPLHALHRELGGRMVPFAGYEMPVQYKAGIIAEHMHTRTAAGLFDVSHMGQAILAAEGDPAPVLERLVPGEIAALKPGRMRYTLLLNQAGGILDDLMVTRLTPQYLLLVVNAARKAADFAHMEAHLAGAARLQPLAKQTLLALQGPKAASVMARLCPAACALAFLSAAELVIAGAGALIGRSGYTGEDGFEISVPAAAADTVARALLAEPEVAPIGLGARDSLRLEAGFCLYGHDIDETTSPVEAGLAWTVGKRRRAEGGFPGAEATLKQLDEGAKRRRVGLRPEGRTPAREGAPIHLPDGGEVGRVTSGGFGATIGGPIAMGYVAAAHAEVGTELALIVRGKALPARVAALPFVPPNYRRN